MPESSRDEARTRIVEVLGDSVYHALGLKESLNDERAALEEQDADGLAKAVVVKGDCVVKLQQLEKQRADICEAAGFGAGPQQMEDLAGWCDNDTVIADCWSHLMDIATDCNELNLTNGAIIRLRQQHIDSNLAVLRGTDRNSDTYGRTGSDQAGRNQRSLAEA